MLHRLTVSSSPKWSTTQADFAVDLFEKNNGDIWMTVSSLARLTGSHIAVDGNRVFFRENDISRTLKDVLGADTAGLFDGAFSGQRLLNLHDMCTTQLVGGLSGWTQTKWGYARAAILDQLKASRKNKEEGGDDEAPLPSRKRGVEELTGLNPSAIMAEFKKQLLSSDVARAHVEDALMKDEAFRADTAKKLMDQPEFRQTVYRTILDDGGMRAEFKSAIEKTFTFEFVKTLVNSDEFWNQLKQK